MDPAMTTGAAPTPGHPALVLGLAIMLAGLVLTLDNLGLVDGGVVFRFWPLVLIAVGVVEVAVPGAAGLGRLPLDRGRRRAPARDPRPHVVRRGVWAAPDLRLGANIVWRALAAGRGPRGSPSAALDCIQLMGGAKRRTTDGLPRRPGDRGPGRLRDRPAPRVDPRGPRGRPRHLRVLGRDRDQGARGLGGREPRQRLAGRRSRTRRRPLPGATEAARRDGPRDHGRRRGQELDRRARRAPEHPIWRTGGGSPTSRPGALVGVLIAVQLVLAGALRLARGAGASPCRSRCSSASWASGAFWVCRPRRSRSPARALARHPARWPRPSRRRCGSRPRGAGRRSSSGSTSSRPRRRSTAQAGAAAPRPRASRSSCSPPRCTTCSWPSRPRSGPSGARSSSRSPRARRSCGRCARRSTRTSSSTASTRSTR